MKLCACLGAMYGEPYCACKMEELGLPLNEKTRAEEDERFEKQVREFMAKGGFNMAEDGK